MQRSKLREQIRANWRSFDHVIGTGEQVVGEAVKKTIAGGGRVLLEK